jgi:hypothetical protein
LGAALPTSSIRPTRVSGQQLTEQIGSGTLLDQLERAILSSVIVV